VFLVRSTSGFKQEDETATELGRQLRMTDNAPPWWIHATAFSGAAPPVGGLASILGDVWCWMFRAHKGSTAGPGHASGAGWYIAHVLRAKPEGDGPPERWDEVTARRRFIRNFSPLNQFLVPKGSGADVGERAAVIATIADWYKARYGTVFDRFLEDAGVRPGEIGRPSWDAIVGMHAPPLEPRTSSPMAPRLSASPRTTPSTTRTMSPCWSSVLAGGRGNPRAGILDAAPDARARLRSLTAGLTVEGLVGVANALFNRCDPPDVAAAAPGDKARQAQLAWSYLEAAKASPTLGGKWAKAVRALDGGSAEGIAALAVLDLDGFVIAALRIVSQVYRKV
jgi:hypothetical protein